MDATTINGAKLKGGLNGGMINFSDAPSGLNFSNPPDFEIGNWSFPNRLPENNFASSAVNFMGTINKCNPLKIMVITSISNHGEIVLIDGVQHQSVDSEVYEFCTRESEILTEFFDLPENIWSVPFHPMGRSPEEYQELLDARFSQEWKSNAYIVFESVYNSMEAGTGGIIIDPDVNWWDLIPIDFSTGEIDLENLITPWNMPFEFYGPADANRFWLFFNNCYDSLSKSYGTGKKLGMFPERISKFEQFFQNVWSGIKKFFPGLIIARTAFRGLVALNIFQLADKLADGNISAIEKTWEGFGGDWNSLKSSINSGATNGGIGSATGIAAMVTSATPILLTLLKLLDNDDITDTSNEILGFINTMTSEQCAEFTSQMLEFTASFNLEELSISELDSIFETDFPEIPQECIQPLIDLVVDKGGNNSGGGTEESGGGNYVDTGGGGTEESGGGNYVDTGGGGVDHTPTVIDGGSILPLVIVGSIAYLLTK